MPQWYRCLWTMILGLVCLHLTDWRVCDHCSLWILDAVIDLRAGNFRNLWGSFPQRCLDKILSELHSPSAAVLSRFFPSMNSNVFVCTAVKPGETGHPVAVYPWHCLVPFLAASPTPATTQRQLQQQHTSTQPADTLPPVTSVAGLF